ncbi:MAG: hypothetical protein ACI9U2_000265 [Bradymonadia bacterium]|jgi:hypothetical protein
MSNANDAVLSQWKQIVEKAWENDSFRKMLVENPLGVLKAAGMDPGVGSVVIHENDSNTKHFVLPARPPEVGVEEIDGALMGDANPGF